MPLHSQPSEAAVAPAVPANPFDLSPVPWTTNTLHYQHPIFVSSLNFLYGRGLQKMTVMVAICNASHWTVDELHAKAELKRATTPPAKTPQRPQTLEVRA